MKYKFIARSPSDPEKEKPGLGFHTIEAAEAHANTMNELLKIYPDGMWNTKYWKTQPEQWIVEGITS